MSEQRWKKWEPVIGSIVPEGAEFRWKDRTNYSDDFCTWYTPFHKNGLVTQDRAEFWEFRIPDDTPASPAPPKIIPHIPWLQSVVATFDEADRIEFQRRLVDLGNWVVAKKQENEQRKEVTA